MKTILILLLSFNAISQDTIPCDMTRQQSRLYFGVLTERVKLEKRKVELADAQHKRDNTKELKFLRYEYKSLKARINNVRDSLTQSYNIKMIIEVNRNNEALKTLRNELNTSRNEYKILKKESNKKVNANIVWIICGVLGVLVLLLLMRIRK